MATWSLVTSGRLLQEVAVNGVETLALTVSAALKTRSVSA